MVLSEQGKGVLGMPVSGGNDSKRFEASVGR